MGQHLWGPQITLEDTRSCGRKAWLARKLPTHASRGHCVSCYGDIGLHSEGGIQCFLMSETDQDLQGPFPWSIRVHHHPSQPPDTHSNSKTPSYGHSSDIWGGPGLNLKKCSPRLNLDEAVAR